LCFRDSLIVSICFHTTSNGLTRAAILKVASL
jgi:hypothetical protein